jgi:hypothetical protein
MLVATPATTGADKGATVSIEPFPQEPFPQNDRPMSRRRIISCSAWLFVWPIVVYVSFSLIGYLHSTAEIALCGLLFFVGSLLWVGCWGAVYHSLFAIAEARWPIARTIRRIISFLVGLVRFFHHHPAP